MSFDGVFSYRFVAIATVLHEIQLQSDRVNYLHCFYVTFLYEYIFKCIKRYVSSAHQREAHSAIFSGGEL